MASAGETGALLPRGEEAEFASCYSNVWYRRYILLLLFLIATLQTTDRNIPAILLPKMGPEFHMSDAARASQRRGVRVHLRARHHPPRAHSGYVRSEEPPGGESLIVWSHPHVPQRALPEHLPAVRPSRGHRPGRGGCTLAAQSLIAIMYGPGERASAMAIQQLGLAAGMSAANLVGGLLIDSLGWRGVFGVMGIPGYVPAALLLLTLEDPPVGGHREVHRRNRLSRGHATPRAQRRRHARRASETDDFGQTCGGASRSARRTCASA